MQTACYRCGATLEEGVPFCPQCGAPQIRVPGPENQAESSAASTFTPGTPANIEPPAVPIATSQVNWQVAVRAAALAGTGAAVLSQVPIISLGCCLWILGAGALAIGIYRRWVPEVVLTTGAGAKLGALTGVLGFAVYAVISALLLAFSTFVLGRGEDIRNELRRAIEQSASANAGDPRVADMVARLSTPEGLAMLLTVMVVMFFITFVVFGAIGGSIGAAMYAPKDAPPPRPE